MPPFFWEEIDHSLVRLRLTNLAEEMHSQIKADERRIQFENRGNQNTNTVPSLVLKMKRDRADEWARRVYEVYCDVWQKQGYEKSAAFVRAVYARGIVSVLRARTGAIAAEFSGFATRTSFPGAISNAHLQGLRLNMQRLEGRWRRRVEIEAKELEHAEAIARLSSQTLQRTYATAKTLGLTGIEVNLQSPTEDGHQTTEASRTQDIGKASSESVGRRRAADVVRAFGEIAEVRGQMNCDSDYDVLKAKYPTFMLFKVCDREPELRELLLGIQGHHQKQSKRLAKQVAAAHNAIRLNTIEKAWDLYNPNKKTRQPGDKRNSAKRPLKPRRRSL